MGIFWASNPADQLKADNEFKDVPSACPVKSNLPIPSSTASSSLQSACPIVNNNTDELNPNTNMPYNLSTMKAPGQSIDLPTNRSLSTIPRGDTSSEGVWEYPSPQQMFNAMLKKGKGDIPEDAVESMVNIHNFLNEGAWEEILEWEKPHTLETHVEPRLLKFTGRPDAMSPRAKYYNLMSKLFPESYNSEPPFDRHDWTVLRSDGNGGWIDVRYVIDYYSGGDDAFGLPSFFLDVRPALDNFGNAKDRFNHWTTEYKPLWDKAMGRVNNDNKDNKTDEETS